MADPYPPVAPLLIAEKFVALVIDGDHNSTYKIAAAIALLQAA